MCNVSSPLKEPLPPKDNPPRAGNPPSWSRAAAPPPPTAIAPVPPQQPGVAAVPPGRARATLRTPEGHPAHARGPPRARPRATPRTPVPQGSWTDAYSSITRRTRRARAPVRCTRWSLAPSGPWSLAPSGPSQGRAAGRLPASTHGCTPGRRGAPSCARMGSCCATCTPTAASLAVRTPLICRP